MAIREDGYPCPSWIRRTGVAACHSQRRRLLMKFRLIVVTLAAMAIGAAGGCGSKGPKLFKVSGTVKFKDGTLIPVPEKGKGKAPTITFNLVGDPPPGQQKKGAGGTIDENGHFELMTFKPGDGVMPGKYVATITANEKYPPDPKFNLVHDKYLKAATSGLEYTIDAPKSDLVVELDKPERK
jgi:hypothetical protein